MSSEVHFDPPLLLLSSMPIGYLLLFSLATKNIDICRKEERPFTIYSKHGLSIIVRITYMRGENAINFFSVDACPCFCIKMNWTVVWTRIVNSLSQRFCLYPIYVGKDYISLRIISIFWSQHYITCYGNILGRI